MGHTKQNLFLELIFICRKTLQVFMDMAVLVTTQGEQLDDIESQVGKARSFVERGREQLQVARNHQKNTRKWTCFGIILLLVIILVIVLPIVLNNKK